MKIMSGTIIYYKNGVGLKLKNKRIYCLDNGKGVQINVTTLREDGEDITKQSVIQQRRGPGKRVMDVGIGFNIETMEAIVQLYKIYDKRKWEQNQRNKTVIEKNQK